MPHDDHEQSARTLAARCAVVTLSDTRTQATDTSGQRIANLLQADGHTVAEYRIIRDEPAVLAALLDDLLSRPHIDAILTTGGTGIGRRDSTIPVIRQRLDTVLDGYGELFRSLSYHEIGPAAMMSRAIGGIARGKLLLAMPGSTPAVELAMTKLILPQLRHLLWELRR